MKDGDNNFLKFNFLCTGFREFFFGQKKYGNKKAVINCLVAHSFVCYVVKTSY